MKLAVALIAAALLTACATTEPTAEQKAQEAKDREAMKAGASQLKKSGAVVEDSALNPPQSDLSVDL
ncbi:hypothetical protein [Cerasicoccus maritimus]|uniref:hypothetical protein n=1 Tax=Cerasicoccus maritimus TaxID=490089 RepID=UPI002852D88E|nr:hypothetical protein [Cerasicoccus maritimus]